MSNNEYGEPSLREIVLVTGLLSILGAGLVSLFFSCRNPTVKLPSVNRPAITNTAVTNNVLANNPSSDYLSTPTNHYHLSSNDLTRISYEQLEIKPYNFY